MHLIPDEHNLYLIGDYHSNAEILKEGLEQIQTPASVVMLGDYDVVEAADLVRLQELLAEYDVSAYLLRGNHDCTAYWQDRSLAEVLRTPDFTLVQDVDCLIWRGKSMLTVSGAVSVDRTCIRNDEGRCWPDTEMIPDGTEQQVRELVSEHGSFDTLLSHTGVVDGMAVKNAFVDSYASTDENLYKDIEHERKLIERLEVVSACKEHFFGHFHRSWIGETYGVQKRCLDICEMIQL